MPLTVRVRVIYIPKQSHADDPRTLGCHHVRVLGAPEEARLLLPLNVRGVADLLLLVGVRVRTGWAGWQDGRWARGRNVTLARIPLFPIGGGTERLLLLGLSVFMRDYDSQKKVPQPEKKSLSTVTHRRREVNPRLPGGGGVVKLGYCCS